MDEQQTPPRRIGCAIFGWTFLACMAIGLGWFGQRVWFYYGKLRSGEIVELPQYTQKLTSTGGVADAPIQLTNAIVVGRDRPSEGPEDAALTVTVFADFECPYSKDAYAGYRSLMAKYGDSVRFVYRDYPLESIHSSAMQAAIASECAKEQGRFWAYHDKLFAVAPHFGFADLVRYAVEVGLDEKQFERCLAEERYRAVVEEDRDAAAALGIRGTPTFFFNGRPVEGAVPHDVLESLILKFTK